MIRLLGTKLTVKPSCQAPKLFVQKTDVVIIEKNKKASPRGEAVTEGD